MSNKSRNLIALAGVILIGVYSVVMMATSGSANWAWIILVAALALVAVSARGWLSDSAEEKES